MKNISFLVRTFETFALQSKNSHLKLILIDVKDQTFGNSNILCIPHLPSEKIKTYHQRALEYVPAFHYESFNYPVIEALSQKCPVVALDKSITPEQLQFINIAENEREFISHLNTLYYQDNKKLYIIKLNELFHRKDLRNYSPTYIIEE